MILISPGLPYKADGIFVGIKMGNEADASEKHMAVRVVA